MDYAIIYPAELDDYDWYMTGKKGWIDVTVRWDGGEQLLEFYDPVRLGQCVDEDIRQVGRFFGRNVIVVPEVTEAAIEAAVVALAARDFVDIAPDQGMAGA
ncbi:hypothetical protein [Dactylosporangium sp. NPDC050588]|uniref:hypothetical protein n=1 Tax=Dactylosporangium sp. NPDC050588 TaxID=3157211 RepID=UPI0033C86CF8